MSGEKRRSGIPRCCVGTRRYLGTRARLDHARANSLQDFGGERIAVDLHEVALICRHGSTGKCRMGIDVAAHVRLNMPPEGLAACQSSGGRYCKNAHTGVSLNLLNELMSDVRTPGRNALTIPVKSIVEVLTSWTMASDRVLRRDRHPLG